MINDKRRADSAAYQSDMSRLGDDLLKHVTRRHLHFSRIVHSLEKIDFRVFGFPSLLNVKRKACFESQNLTMISYCLLMFRNGFNKKNTVIIYLSALTSRIPCYRYRVGIFKEYLTTYRCLPKDRVARDFWLP